LGHFPLEDIQKTFKMKRLLVSVSINEFIIPSLTFADLLYFAIRLGSSMKEARLKGIDI
jgi:hypothetical protein